MTRELPSFITMALPGSGLHSSPLFTNCSSGWLLEQCNPGTIGSFSSGVRSNSLFSSGREVDVEGVTRDCVESLLGESGHSSPGDKT